MWVMDADLRFARAHYAQIVDTMCLLDADYRFVRAHYVQIVNTMV